MTKPAAALRRNGFTLVELLVVIGIIAMLIAIILPAMSKSRAAAAQVVCLSNLHQVVIAFYSYSLENKSIIPGTYWDGSSNLDWGGANNSVYRANPSAYSHPYLTSVLKKYIGSDRILVCPTAARPNAFFDYTMVCRLRGAKTNLPGRMSYPIHPESSTSPRKYFDQIPILVEENQFFYNVPIDDGSFGNLDQFSHRHSGRCNVGYLDGSAGAFKSPTGPLGEGVQETQDLTCNGLLYESSHGKFIVGQTDSTEFGWANNPHLNPAYGW